MAVNSRQWTVFVCARVCVCGSGVSGTGGDCIVCNLTDAKQFSFHSDREVETETEKAE